MSDEDIFVMTDSVDAIKARVRERMAGAGDTKPKAKPAAKKKTSSPKPPNTVTPGWVHKAIAAKMLAFMRDNSEQAFGKPLDVGELPETNELALEGGIIDNRSPLELLSRIIAHIFHRVPGLSKVERRLEGTQRSSGIMSDISAFVMNIYGRNESLIKEVKDTAIQQRKAQENGNVPV